MSILQSDITSEQPVFVIYYDFFLKFLYICFFLLFKNVYICKVKLRKECNLLEMSVG